MTQDPELALERCFEVFPDRHVLVLGDAILDEYVEGECARISPEAPVPVVRVTGSRRVLGGAANTAANVRSLGGRATLVTFIGADEAGQALTRCAAEAGVTVRAIDAGMPTLRKTRVVGQHQQIVRLDYEDPRPAPEATHAEVLRALEALLPAADVVVISDYAKGFVSSALAQHVIARAKDLGRPVVVDPRPQHRDAYVGCDYITPNWREARALLRLPDADPTDVEVEAVSRQLSAALGCSVVLTLGAHGIAYRSSDGQDWFTMPTLAREVFDVSGAGDTVVAAFALALAARADHRTAIALANRAASVVVGKFGTATVAPEEVLHSNEATRVLSRRGLGVLADRLKAKGKRVVTINGAFDLLHAGHLHILDEAREQGDVLIVGLNSDASVRAYKGPERPLVSEDQRARMLLALRSVDYVHVFDELDPIAFLEEVRPDVHVNGSEYGEDCIESATVRRIGARLHLVGRMPGLSTSGLLEGLRGTRPGNGADA